MNASLGCGVQSFKYGSSVDSVTLPLSNCDQNVLVTSTTVVIREIYYLQYVRSQKYPGCQRLFMRGFRFRVFRVLVLVEQREKNLR